MWQERQQWLEQRLTTRVTLYWTRNRTAMLSVTGQQASGYRLRIHQLFRDAPDAVWLAVLGYVRAQDRAAAATIRAYIRQHSPLHTNASSTPRRVAAQETRGRYFDLEAIYGALNSTYFAERIQATITWGRQGPQRHRHSIRFGAYYPMERLIRIHRALDQAFVPHYVVEHVVFHEMLHQLIPRQQVNGRWLIHPPDFREQERRFPAYQQAQQWQRQHLSRLLRS